MRCLSCATPMEISQLQEAKKKTDKKAKAVLTDYTGLEQEFEDYKPEAQSNLEQHEVQLEAMDAERNRLCIAAGPLLDMLCPTTTGSNSKSVDQVAGLLKTTPKRVRNLVKEHATIGCSQALSVIKSLYPLVEIATIGEGYAAGTTEEKALQLINDVHDVVAIIAEDAVEDPVKSRTGQTLK